MLNLLLIFIGCGLGGVLRYSMSYVSFCYFSHSFPYDTLIINISGSFLMGLFAILLSMRLENQTAELWRLFLLVGLLGGYTTFSSFSLETIGLLQQGEIFKSLIHIFASVFGCLTSCYLGMLLGKLLVLYLRHAINQN